MAWPDLFDLDQLPSWLQIPSVDTSTATLIRQVVDGWLKSATRLTAWPNPIPNDLLAWAIELAGIAYRTPVPTTSEAIDDYHVSYDRSRRKEILDAARAAYGGSSLPQYSFPEWDWHWEVLPPVSSLTL